MPLKNSYAHLGNFFLQGQKVLVRADLNVPLEKGKVREDTRLVRGLKTLRFLKQQGAQIILLSHLGRATGKVDPLLSLSPVSQALNDLAPDLQVVFCPFFTGGEASSFIQKEDATATILLENLRFDGGEVQNDADFVRGLASLGDFYVNDAFSVSHRAHGSIVGLPAALPAAAGFFFEEEICALRRVLEKPQRPLMALVAGAKISTKRALLENLLSKVDILAIGGAMAHPFLEAQGVPLGASLTEENSAAAQAIMALAKKKNRTLLLPIDGVVAEKLASGVKARVVRFSIDEKNPLRPFESIFDVGPETIDLWAAFLKSCKTLVWNGPLGAFETPPFFKGTHIFAKIAADFTKRQELCSVVGGGDTLAALPADVLGQLTYASGSGGAFLEWLEGKHLPGLKALEEAYLRR